MDITRIRAMLMLAKLLRYARGMVNSAENAYAWRGLAHKIVQIMKGVAEGSIPSDRIEPMRTFMKLDGGTGSGNHGHEGRPGKVGGSAPTASNLSESMSMAFSSGDYEDICSSVGKVLERMPVGSSFGFGGTITRKVGEGKFESVSPFGDVMPGRTMDIAASIAEWEGEYPEVRFEVPSSKDVAAAKVAAGELEPSKTSLLKDKKSTAHSQEQPVAFKGNQIVDVSKEQFQSLRKEIEANTGKAVSNEEVKQYLSAIDEYRGSDYVGVLAASADFKGLYKGYSSLLDAEERARLTETAGTVEKFIASANKYEGKVMRAMGFDVGGEYDNGSWDALSEKLRPGKTLDMGHFSSWTIDDSTVTQVLQARTGVDDSAEKSIEVVITCNNSKSGADIGRFSKDFTQGEVLFGKNQRFRVTNVKQRRQYDKIERYDVTVEEV